MAQVQLDNYSGSKHEETSQDSLTEVDESRPPNPSLIFSMDARATDPSLNISSPRAAECLSPAQTKRIIQWRKELMTELEQGNVDLLTYQQTIGGSIFKYDHATQDDVDFDEPLLERLRRKDDEEIIVLESWEIVAPLPVGEPPAPAVQCLPPSSQPAEPSVPEPAVPCLPKKMKEMDSAIIHSLKTDLKEKEDTIKALERKKEYIVTAQDEPK